MAALCLLKGPSPLTSISRNASCIPWLHLLFCYWLKFLQWPRWSHDQMILWSVIKWPVCSSVKSNWWPPEVQNKFLGLVHKCMTPNFIWFIFFSFHWHYSSPPGHFFFLWYYSTICPVLTTSPILVPSVYFIITLLLIVSRSGMEILIIPCAVSIQTFSWSPGKLNLSEFPWENPLIFSW